MSCVSQNVPICLYRGGLLNRRQNYGNYGYFLRFVQLDVKHCIYIVTNLNIKYPRIVNRATYTLNILCTVNSKGV